MADEYFIDSVKLEPSDIEIVKEVSCLDRALCDIGFVNGIGDDLLMTKWLR